MNAKQFLILLNKGNSLEKEDFHALVKLRETFPYFSVPAILAAKYQVKNGEEQALELLHWAAIQSPDRTRLRQLVEQDIEFLPPPLPQTSQEKTAAEDISLDQPDVLPPAIEEVPAQDPLTETRKEILRKLEENLNRFKNVRPAAIEKEPPSSLQPAGDALKKEQEDEDLLATIKKKEKKVIVDARKKEQNDLIKAFSKKSIKLETIRENRETENLSDLSKNSTLFNDKLVSESFAKLLSKQNKKDQAIEIYQKLILKFPEKSAYFAALIKELED